MFDIVVFRLYKVVEHGYEYSGIGTRRSIALN